MELTLDINMNTEDFASFKDEVFKAAMKKGACDEGIEYHLSSTTPQEWLDNCGKYLGWLGMSGIDITLEGFKYCEGDLYLEGYNHRLPNGFTHCDGGLDLECYELPLPNTFTHCNGGLSLNDYDYPLPISFTHCGGYLLNNFYNHPLPNRFKSNVKKTIKH